MPLTSGFQSHTLPLNTVRKDQVCVALGRIRPLRLFFFFCHTNVCVKRVWHTAVTTHHTNNPTSEFPLSSASLSLHNEQTIPSIAHRSNARRFCWEAPIAAVGNPVTKVTTTAFCLRHTGARDPPLHHKSPTTIWKFTDRYISVPCYCLQKGPETVLVLNYTSVNRVRGYAKATARKSSEIQEIASTPETQLEQGILEIPEEECG